MWAIRMRNWLRDSYAFGAFGFDALTVMNLRMAKLFAGGVPAALEAQRMVTEKQMAIFESQLAAASALALGYSHRTVGRRAMEPYRRRVAANRRRLSGK